MAADSLKTPCWHERANPRAIGSTSMRALVTGASGFVGGWLCQQLTDSGDEVVASSVDVADADAVIGELEAVAPHAVYHLAAQADVGASWVDPLATHRVNMMGTAHLLEGARRLSRPPRVLIACSADVYGPVSPAELPLTEDSPLRPTSPYAASKVAAEFLGIQAGLGFGVPVIRARAFNHAGPGQSPAFVVSSVARQIAALERSGGGELQVGDLSPRRDVADVRDVVRAYRMLMLDGVAGEAYNVCSGVDRTIAELVDLLVGAAQCEIKIVVDPARIRPVEVPALRGDPKKLVTATGWVPQIEMSQTLHDVLVYWRSSEAPERQT